MLFNDGICLVFPHFNYHNPKFLWHLTSCSLQVLSQPVVLNTFRVTLKMYNQTFVDSCTYATCSVEEYGQIRYIPSLAGNLFYLSIFGLCLLCQFILGIRYKSTVPPTLHQQTPMLTIPNPQHGAI